MRLRLQLVGALAIAVAAALAVTTSSGHDRQARAADQSPLWTPAPEASTDASPFLLETARHGPGVTLTLRSPQTGRVVRRLGWSGRAFTNNGASVAPGGRSAYITVIGTRSLRIERLSARTRRLAFVADGERPELSPDGTELAYLTGRSDAGAVAVRELGSGVTRRISLARLVGGRRSLLNGQLAWTADGSELVVIVPPSPVPTVSEPSAARNASRSGSARPASRAGAPGNASRSGAAARATHTCSSLRGDRACVILVQVPGSPASVLTATLAARALPDDSMPSIATDQTGARSLLVYSIGENSTISRATVTPAGLRLHRLARIRRFVLAVSPDGDRVLLLHGAQHIWVARISDSHAGATHQLVGHTSLAGVVW